MSIIYEALKKVEGQKEILSPGNIPQSITLPAKKNKKKVSKDKKSFLLPIVILLIVLGLSVLPFILPQQEQAQEQEVIASVAGKREINPARVHRVSEPKGQASKEVTLRGESVQEYILEGIVYDPKAPFALINGRVINESDILGNFQIDKISKDKVEMTNTGDNSKIILSLP